ncbi:S9 family peptidase [Streptomyces jumonjinensis]|uniref:S9 family peptidase n=1 Tax=Streptomyces jumonjinensis TaxID=1945 RepID=A0A646KTQ7_STRJU|nr:S9 family peptidase [Streptomyces jumonjinensis]MQT04396.1 S9 family peptidase [Streptomyces jumonjinensis]
MKTTDIDLLPVLGRPTLSGDGRFAAVTVTRPDLAAEGYTSELWLAETDGSTPARLLTQGPHDAAPAFSPDGRHLAFLRPVPGGPGQLHLLPMDGGEARVVTGHPIGAGQPVWSPDSKFLAYTARVPEPGRYHDTPDREVPRRITTLRHWADGFGFTLDRPRHVFVTDPFADDPMTVTTQVTDGNHDHADVAWSPDSRLLTFTAARHAGAGDDLRNDVWLCAPDGTGLRPLTDGGLILGCPRFSPDGSTVCFAAEPLDENNNTYATMSYGLWSARVDGSGPARRLTGEDYHLSFASQMIHPVADGVLFAADHRGEVNLVMVPYDGGAPKPLITGARQVNGYAAVDGTGGLTVAAVVSSATSAGDLIRLRGTEERELTDFGRQLVKQADLLPAEEFTATAPDGYELHGWIVRPRGKGPHPVLLQIKGGPYTQFGHTLNGPAAFDEAQVYASAGYAVVLGNPRGCSGYGQAHGMYVADDLPRKSAPDLLALLDEALKSPDLDADRVGVMGGSFGGYMSAWMAAHHGDRFRAAIGERGLYAVDSYAASSDDGVNVAIALYGPDPSRWAEKSPLTYADSIRIPMMIIQSEEDRHCPMEQAQRMFVALKSRGVPVEMLLFPGEGHDMSRTGLPSHRVARFEAILDWWGRHL